MPRKHKVQKNEWLSKIAWKYGFRDGGAVIWEANRQRIGDNPDVLPEGLELLIPEPQAKNEARSTGQKATFQLPQKKKNLCLTLQDPEGQPVKGWEFQLTLGDKRWKGKTNDEGKILADDIPETATEAQLEIRQTRLFSLWKFPPEKITLQVGDLDPVVEEKAGRQAIQKILTNLGFYKGKIDGIFGPQTRAALRAFQRAEKIEPAHGLADKPTCERLIRAQGNVMPPPKAPERSNGIDRDQILPLGTDAGRERETVTTLSEYLDPTCKDQTHRVRLGRFRFFPPQVYVAPCNPGEESKNPNVIRMPARPFIFLDVGHWEEQNRDFGLIWGRHVYLCQYLSNPQGKVKGADARPGLDAQFFQAMGGKVLVKKRATASWAPASDFNWDKLYIILPDLHLMNSKVSHIWKPERDETKSLQAEIDLLEFVRSLIAISSLQGKVQVIQLGDLYDLWVGCEPCYFKENNTRTVELEEPDKAKAQLAKWVQDIQGVAPTADVTNWVYEELGHRPDGEQYRQFLSTTKTGTVCVNPAVKALWLLEQAYGVIYLYGNHDNYLLLGEVCAAAHIAPRRRYYEAPGLFVEHGHRLEGTFAMPRPLPVPAYNYDGTRSGYEATVKAFHWPQLLRDAGKWVDGKWCRISDQPQYWGELAQVWLGRQSQGKTPPHVFVIGHTHLPNLLYIDIEA